MWINGQLANEALKEDLITNKETGAQSEELLDAVIQIFGDGSTNNSMDENPATDIFESLTLTIARNGYSPRENGVYIFSLKKPCAKHV